MPKPDPELRRVWEERIAVFRSSGLSVAAWCATNDVKDHQLRYWLQKLDPQKNSKAPSSKWVSFQVKDPSFDAHNSLLVRVGSMAVEVKSGVDPALLSTVVRTLQTLC